MINIIKDFTKNEINGNVRVLDQEYMVNLVIHPK